MEGMERGGYGSKETIKHGLRKGGFRATMFIFVMTGLENIGFVANMVSMVLYFLLVMHFDLADSATTLTNFMGSTFLLTIVGGFIADTFLTRLNTVLVFALFQILGYILVTIQARRPNLRPPALCLTCKLEGKNAAMFYVSLGLLALGYGGVRGAYPALGADQFDKNNPKERKSVASFFNWLLLSITLGATLGVTVIVWVSTERSWALGFFISLMCAILGFCIITAGKPFYRSRIVKDSPLLKLFQVIVAAIRNRKLILPENPDDLYETAGYEKGSDDDDFDMIPHSKQFRCLDKAAILPIDARPEAWRVCTVSQVEELKILIRMLPILGSTILMNTCLAQLQTFSVQQGNIMDLHLGSFQVPAASIPVIPLIFMSALVPVYEFIFVPLARRFTRHPNGITTLQRVGVGLVLSAISMAIGALIEVKRRDAFNKEGRRISLFWLSFQYGVFGIADLFTLVGLMDFFYGEAPAGLRSLSTSFSWLSLSFGYFLSTVLVRAVNSVTAKGTASGHGWLYGIDLNQNRLDLFFWFLTILSCINFVLFLLCAKWYKYRKVIINYNAARADDQHQCVDRDDDDDHHEHVKDQEKINVGSLHEKSKYSLEASKDLNGAMHSTVAIYPSPGAYPSPTPSSISTYSPMTLETRELIRP